MKTPRQYLALVFLVVALPFHSFADETRLENCPAAVQSAIKSAATDGRIDDIDFRPARRIYDVEIDLGPGRERRLLITESGEVLETTEEIALTDAPEVVRRILETETGSADRLDSLERKTAGGTTTFLAEIDVAGGRDLHLEISDKGSILSRRDGD